MMNRERVAQLLLTIQAVHLRPDNPFTWASGIQSPIYCDNRLIMGYPDVRQEIANAFVQTIQTSYGNVDVIAGTATAGIPHAAWVAQSMEKPMIYVRSSAKGHGKQNMIEGVLRPGQKVVVIEDLISTGQSVLKVVDALREAGADVLGVVAIFTYGLQKAVQQFEQHQTPFTTLTSYDELIPVAVREGFVTEQQVEQLKQWKHSLENRE
ncbi:orotate phosphoribosyltransferase [Fodinisporobacter ferrooxydans]|uniref:Orotate phosphoribosyltransferase n=1 Tax=Fodinisporobacter ferrooxydans TaxID=2901836 RepID=A0ABY4CNX4_9BACL|nr:orotate phosphoribosyltransferase [Alicyclobacillaceae bacterium MYW30-H2]